jgi:hypothetical protein
VERLIVDPVRRAQLGAGGESRVRRLFSVEDGIDLLAARFGTAPASRRDNEPVLWSPEQVGGGKENATQMECVLPFTHR